MQMEAKRLPVFSQRLLELQGEMNQAKFAEVLGISRTSVCLYESGTRIPDALILRKIAQKCHVSADWLLGLSDVKSTDTDMQRVCGYTGLSEMAVYSLQADRFQASSDVCPSDVVDCLLSDYGFEDDVMRDINMAVNSLAHWYALYNPDSKAGKSIENAKKHGYTLLDGFDAYSYYLSRAFAHMSVVLKDGLPNILKRKEYERRSAAAKKGKRAKEDPDHAPEE